MQIYVGNAYAKVIEATAAEEQLLRSYLTFTSSSYQGSEHADCLLTKNRLFPAGLASRVLRHLGTLGHEALCAGRSAKHLQNPGHLLQVEDRTDLWPHQVAALDAVHAQHRGIVQHGTGTGKGTTIAALVRELRCPVLVLVTSKKLLQEMYDRIKAVALETPGRLGDGYKELNKRILVATVQSISRLPKEALARFGAVLGDEVHGSAAAGYLRAVMSCVNASIRVGFSGTPLNRGDKKTIYTIGAFGEVIHRYMPSQAANDGIVARASVTMSAFHHTHVDASMGYTTWEKRALAKNEDRNKMIARLLGEYPAPRIVFVRTHEHQKELVRLLGDAATWVNDKVHPEEAKRRVRKLVRGEFSTLVSTPIFRQGVDIPEVATVVQASGGKSTIDVIQKVGRGSRRFQKDGTTKDVFHVVDIADRDCGCGGRHKGCHWLTEHTAERQRAYEQFGYFVKFT